MLCTRKAYPKKNNYLLHLSRNDSLPFTLPFFFRFSSGTCILYTTSVYSSVSLPFLFRDHVFFKNVDSGDFVIPSLNFDRRSFIALHRGLKRLSYIYIYGWISFVQWPEPPYLKNTVQNYQVIDFFQQMISLKYALLARSKVTVKLYLVHRLLNICSA